jgi:hypothetical protein
MGSWWVMKKKPQKARSGAVTYTGSGFHTPAKFGKKERHKWKKDLKRGEE